MKSRLRPGALLFGFVLILFVGVLVFFRFASDAVPPDPNAPDEFGQRDIDVIQSEISRFYLMVRSREERGQISKKTQERYFRNFVRERANQIRIDKIPVKLAWKYGEVFRAANMWPEAKRVFEIAVKAAPPNEDRRVNDTLRLAQCEAKLGQVSKAIELAYSTFDAPPGNKPPILFAVYLEIVPAAQGQGYDRELARLIRGAVEQSRAAIVVPSSSGGRDFLQTREYHINRALELALSLENGATRIDP